jgi:hypothetical protein
MITSAFSVPILENALITSGLPVTRRMGNPHYKPLPFAKSGFSNQDHSSSTAAAENRSAASENSEPYSSCLWGTAR